jgi:hypothetical protein
MSRTIQSAIKETSLKISARELRSTVFAVRDLAYDLASVNNVLSEDIIDVLNDYFNTEDYHQLDYKEYMQEYYKDTIAAGTNVEIWECQELLSENLMVDIADMIKDQYTITSKKDQGKIADEIIIGKNDLAFFIGAYLQDELSHPESLSIELINENVSSRLVDEATNIPLDVIVEARSNCKYDHEEASEEPIQTTAARIKDCINEFDLTSFQILKVFEQVIQSIK